MVKKQTEQPLVSQISISNVFINAVLLLLFFIPLNASFLVGAVHTHPGARLSESARLIHGALVMTSSQPLHVGLFDICNIVLLFCLLCCYFANRILFKQFRISLLWLFFLAFAAWAFASLAVNYHLYSNKQWLVCLMYFLKFCSILLVYFYIRVYFLLGGKLVSLQKVLLVSLFFSAVIGLLYNHINAMSAVFVRDRESYFGVLSMLLFCIMMIAVFLKQRHVSLHRFWQYLLWINLVLLPFSICWSGKRGVILALIVALLFIFILLKDTRRYLPFIVVGLLLASVSLLHAVQSTFDVSKKTVPWGGLAPKQAVYLKDFAGEYPWLAKDIPGDLSYSVTSRFARWLESLSDVSKRPVAGVGFWGAQYVYGFLPDSLYFRVLLDTGIVGALILLCFLLRLFYVLIVSSSHSWPIRMGILSAFAYFGVAGLSANTLYIYNLLAIVMILIALLDISFDQHEVEIC